MRVKIARFCGQVSALRPTWHSVPPRRVARWPDCDPFERISVQRPVQDGSTILWFRVGGFATGIGLNWRIP